MSRPGSQPAQSRPARTAGGFALVDALACVALAGALGATLGIGVLGQNSPADPVGAREQASMMRDASSQRAMIQGMIIWAGSNKDSYPLPSDADRADTTVSPLGLAKNTTANIFSLMVFNSLLTPEQLISAAENNPNIREYKGYELVLPKKAVNPGKAMWDPGMSADFTAGPANISFAHLELSTSRRQRWKDTFSADNAVVSTRGPRIVSVQVTDESTATPTFADEKSNTFQMFKQTSRKGKWSGCVAFSDGRVEFIENHFAPKHKTVTGKTYDDKTNKKRPDMAFFDEPDDPISTNNFFGIFTSAGEKPADFKSIWD
ncbi:MAG: hypothetical protein IBJ18_05040 [Phycisphaerales bacterium]|nr:hypothetical protein [Phycisphaerales bacterium]